MTPEVHAQMAAVQATHWWFAARRRILAAVIGRLRLPVDASILEIGCGSGGNLAMLAGFGHLQSMESNEQARRVAQGLGICAVSPGSLPDDVPFDDGSFDLVCLLDVLEHVHDDRAALERVARLLKPGGRLLLTVPAYAWLWSSHDTVHGHQHRYTAGDLRDRALRAGLSVSRLGYFNSLLFPLIAAARLAGRLLGHDRGSDAVMPSPLVNTLLQAVFGLERHLVPKTLFPAGTSVLAVCSAKR